MARKSNVRQTLERVARKRVEKAIVALLADDDAVSAQRHLAWAETAQRAVRASAGPGPHLAYVAFFILLLASTLVLLAWSLSPHANLLRFSVQVDGLQLVTAEPWIVTEDMPLSRVEARGLGRFRMSSLGGLPVKKLRMDDMDGRLQRLELSRDASVDLEFSGGGLGAYVRAGTLSGKISIARGKLVAVDVVGKRVSRDLNLPPGMPPELIGFSANRSSQDATPIGFELASKHLHISAVTVDDILFTREDPPRSGRWVPTVVKGEGKFLDVDRTIALKSGDWLKLEGISGLRVTLTPVDKGARIEFEGDVRRVLYGPTESTMKDITPSWLEYLAHSKRVELLWGALTFLWVMLWRMRGMV